MAHDRHARHRRRDRRAAGARRERRSGPRPRLDPLPRRLRARGPHRPRRRPPHSAGPRVRARLGCRGRGPRHGPRRRLYRPGCPAHRRRPARRAAPLDQPAVAQRGSDGTVPRLARHCALSWSHRLHRRGPGRAWCGPTKTGAWSLSGAMPQASLAPYDAACIGGRGRRRSRHLTTDEHRSRACHLWP